MCEIHTCDHFEQFGNHMRGGTAARGAEIEFARPCFGERDELFGRARRHRGMHHQYVGQISQQAYRLQVLRRIVGELRINAIGGMDAYSAEHDGVAIGHSARDKLGADMPP